jgi:hypothetical protein
MYFLIYAVFPKPTHRDYGKMDGAYVSLFVNEPTQSLAESAARGLFEAESWDVEELDEAYETTLDNYSHTDPSRAIFEQALIDGVVATFHRWPIAAPAEDEDSSGAVA